MKTKKDSTIEDLVIIRKLELIRNYANESIKEIRNAPEKAILSELMKALYQLDTHYKDYCEECDEDYGYEKGTHYREDMNMKWYIEGLQWHEVSLLLRELKKLK